MEMSNLAAKLKSLKLELGEDLIVHLILISLPTHFGYFNVRSFFETRNARILEDVEFGKEENNKNVVFEEESINDIDYDEAFPQTPIEQHQQPQEVLLRRSIRERRHAIPDDYIVFLKEHEDDIGLTEDDLINFYQAMQSVKPVGCKWIFKTKKDSKGNIKRYKASLVAKGFRRKDSFRIVITLVTHFDLELHQMDVKTVFLNGDIDETIYMMQPKNFVSNESKSMILRDRSQSILRLSQENYINKVLKRFNMKDSKLGDTLIAKGDKFSLKQCPNDDLERNEMQKIPYSSVVGSLMYLSDSGMQHWKAVKHVMRYLRRTKGHMLTYQKFEDLEIIGYSDSDFAGCQDSKCSTSGYIYMLTGGVISWKFVKQTLIAPSTMATEFVACFEASNHGIWLRNFITSLWVVNGIKRPLKIYCDNDSTVLYSNNNRSSTKSKFIDIKFLVVKERV
ncbi:hypothetical protein CR513_55043, partial [Mucuna pruriens]